jgi:histidinol-phosphatase (PHP family)
VLDYHLHLWPHGERAAGPVLDQLAAYCDRAAAAGVEEIAVTEHLFRFVQADRVLGRWWERPEAGEADPSAREAMAHMGADLDCYVEVGLAAKDAGLPVVLGLEVDYYRGRMDEVAELLSGYPFDVLLGSVHWVGAFLFDNVDDETVAAGWRARGVEAVWKAYTEAVEELAATGACDVLAHPDLAKVAGHRPAVPDEFYDRIAEAAASCGLAAEVSSAGLRKPVREAYPAPPLLERFRRLGVPVTTASDAHRLADVADRSAQLRAYLWQAGYEELCAFRARTPRPVPLARP